jgi:hypothetical protein
LAIANLGIGAPWPFPNTSVPLNGHVCIPRERGPFPLAVFAHGNHRPLSNSTPGYLYLCSLLGSQGIVAATIDVNFLNGGNFGENDARGIVHLEHVKQFRTWNSTATHPLHCKIDLNRILIVGHSRGGEGVGHASFFNPLPAIKPDIFSPTVPLDGSAGLGPYRFALRCIAAIAPTDRQYTPITGPTVVPDRYFLIHGSRDGDVSTFEGYNTFNRAHAVDLDNPTVSDGKLKACSGYWAQTTINSTRRGPPKRRQRPRCPAPTRNTSRRSRWARLPRRCCSIASNTWTFCVTTRPPSPGCPRAPRSCRNIRIRNASMCSTSRKPLRRHRSPCRYRERPRPTP